MAGIRRRNVLMAVGATPMPVFARTADLGLGDPPGGNLPPLSTAPISVHFPVMHFSESDWDPYLYAQATAAELCSTGGLERIARAAGAPPQGQREIAGELADLRDKALALRTDRLPEIIRQATPGQFLPYWLEVLDITQASHPQTYGALVSALVVGGIVSCHLKAIWQRPRPTAFYPALMPPIPVPRHPAFPSGHALQGHLVSMAAGQLRPPLRPRLMDLAARVAENREIAGVHFPSDTRAGVMAAVATLDCLDASTRFRATMHLASDEWA
jgi:acid phosphatase (class A)